MKYVMWKILNYVDGQLFDERKIFLIEERYF